MKTGTIKIFCCFTILQFSHANETEERKRNEAKQVELWEKNLAETQDKPDDVKLSELSLGVRNMGFRSFYPGHGREVERLYELLQSEIISIPGHAEYYAKPIREAYQAWRDPSHPKHSGSTNRAAWENQIGMETLKHLPSPETVKVLGEMLSEEWRRELRPDSTVMIPDSMAISAVQTLGFLSLRDKPTPEFEGYEAAKYLPAWQKWYKQVESGERTFSFKGQTEEYRFRDDGTWETIPIANPPDDAPEYAAAVPNPIPGPPEEDRPYKIPETAQTDDRQNLWPWLGAGLAVLALVMVFLIMRRQ